MKKVFLPGFVASLAALVSLVSVAFAAVEIPDCPDEWYLDFTRNGDRTRYEKPYQARIFAFESAIAACRRERTEANVKRLAAYLEAILGERCWTLPAHDGSLDAFYGRKLQIDLGAARRGLAVVEALQAAGDALSPDLAGKARAELERRIFAPYLLTAREAAVDPKRTRFSTAPHWWFRGENNWTAVCHSCVARAALVFYPFGSSERREIVEAAVEAQNHFLNGFADDGYCSEGAGYWNYGFGHFLSLGKALREAPEKIDILSGRKAHTIAEYGFTYRMTESLSPDFSDGGEKIDSRIADLCRSIWPDMPTGPLPRMTAFPISQVWIGRPQKGAAPVSIGFKGGHNGEFHNHNDIGSYDIAVGDVFVAGDVGGETYTARTFSSHRYDSKVLSSYAHPVPRVDGALQSTGRKFAAKVVSESLTGRVVRVTLDLTGAYECPKLRSLMRTFEYVPGAGAVRITDTVRFNEPARFTDPLVSVGVFGDGKISYNGANISYDVRAKGGEWEFQDETVGNPGRLSAHIHAVEFANVTEAEVRFVFSPVD